jgi:hypothetical protein
MMSKPLYTYDWVTNFADDFVAARSLARLIVPAERYKSEQLAWAEELIARFIASGPKRKAS